MDKNKITWKRLYGKKHYQISNHGIIRSIDRTFRVTRNGVTYKVTRSGKELARRGSKENPHLFSSVADVDHKGKPFYKTTYILRAVADHFVPKPLDISVAEKEGKTVCVTPRDGDHNNTHFTNIKWVTLSNVIRKQPNRLKDPTKSWRTRRQLYGRSGKPIKTI